MTFDIDMPLPWHWHLTLICYEIDMPWHLKFDIYLYAMTFAIWHWYDIWLWYAMTFDIWHLTLICHDIWHWTFLKVVTALALMLMILAQSYLIFTDGFWGYLQSKKKSLGFCGYILWILWLYAKDSAVIYQGFCHDLSRSIGICEDLERSDKICWDLSKYVLHRYIWYLDDFEIILTLCVAADAPEK